MKIKNITDDVIIMLWREGLTVKQITKKYVRDRKEKGVKITEIEAQKYVEPIIYKYQTRLMS